MVDIIIIAVIAVAAALGIRSAVMHFKGQGGCCGGGGYRLKKKKLKNVLYTRTFAVEGMHCEHCKNRVEEIVNDIQGISGRVDLKKGELTVSYAQDADDSLMIARIERVGYRVNRK